MPRGRRAIKVKTVEEQIAALDAEIEDYKQKISDAKERKKAPYGT